jgi:predicted ATPase
MLCGIVTMSTRGTMDGKRFLHSIRLTNLLSYGSEGVALSLEPLNVLIGPNASGKSNLVEALSLLSALPRDILGPIRDGGGIDNWIWKGAGSPSRVEVEIVLEIPGGEVPLRYRLAFTSEGLRAQILKETLNFELLPKEPPDKALIYDNRGKLVMVKARTVKKVGRRTIRPASGYELYGVEVSSDQSVFSQIKGADVYPELTEVGELFGNIRFFRQWNLGRLAPPRFPQKADLPGDFLLEDASNLGLVLNDFQHRASTRQILIEKLKLFYESIEEVTTKVQGGTIQVFLHERGLSTPIPATRISDGTIRYLCLLAILLHPEPPPLICLEEPELGLHPDIIPSIAELLIEASQRTQLIVTTHSEMLVSALSGVPESVVVCERDDRGTSLRRLDPEKLTEWLERYRLGDLWAKGEIGGNRW